MNMNNNNMNMENRNIQMLPTMGRLDPLYNNSQPQPPQMENELEEPPKQSNVKLIQLGIIITLSFFTALAWNEAARYYIGRSIKFYSGKPILYVYYAVLASLLALVSYIYSYLK